MTTPSHPAEGGEPDAAPYLPPSRPTDTTETAAPVSDVEALPSLPDAAAPFVPEPTRVAPEPAKPMDFDAKAMVESQKRINANPAYGALPSGTEASRDAANQLRAKAQRKRQRNKRLGWFVGVLMLGGVGAAGWFGYQAYQDDQDQAALERAEESATDGADEPGALTPLGEQVEVIRAQEAVDSAVQPGSGGLLDAVDDARAVVGETNGDASDPAADAAVPAAGEITLADVLPAVVLEAGSRLPDATGRENYVISADEFAAGDPPAFATFVRLLSAQPQTDPAAPVFDTFPTVAPGEIVISVEREGDELRRVVVSAAESQIHVDYAP